MAFILTKSSIHLIVILSFDYVAAVFDRSVNFKGSTYWEKRSGFIHKQKYQLLPTPSVAASSLECGTECMKYKECCSYSFGDLGPDGGQCVLSKWCSWAPGLVESDESYVVHTRNEVLCNLRTSNPEQVEEPPNYTTTFSGAAGVCAAYGAVLADLSHVQHVYDNGKSVCSCGWVSDGIARYPIAYFNSPVGCGGSTPGIRHCDGAVSVNTWCYFQTDALLTVGSFDVIHCFPLQ